ncbi:PREDICTED: WD repeat-containing protein 18-like [Acropora digitifera]|uniref:WD repeat-containing protein 18-like n=1 Tax=Acropora digitifera TaxID=70779 RepID=UPI00077A4E8C|nr:PREDICTED: WD repeat-containing protein 18-like [Acropora digitifera]
MVESLSMAQASFCVTFDGELKTARCQACTQVTLTCGPCGLLFFRSTPVVVTFSEIWKRGYTQRIRARTAWSQESVHSKLVCPGRVLCMASSPDGVYCVVACTEKIYIWQFASGNLLAVLSRHFQPISCLRFTDDGSHFLSSGEDNLVLVWKMSRVLSVSSSSVGTFEANSSPCHTWSDHALPVTDIHCGCGGMRAHVVTSSLDQTCKSCVTLQSLYPFSCSKQVNSVATNMDGSLLLSGSEDHTACVWHVPSRQCLRTLHHRGAVTNATVIPRPLYLDALPPKSCIRAIQPFKRHLHVPGQLSNNHTASHTESFESCLSSDGIPLVLSGKLSEGNCLERSQMKREVGVRQILSEVAKVEDQGTIMGEKRKLSRRELEEELQNLQRMNHKFYKFAVEELVKEVYQSSEGTARDK